MRKLSGVGIRTIKQKLEFEKNGLLMSSKTPKSRAVDQQELGKEMVVLDFMMGHLSTLQPRANTIEETRL